MTKSQYDEILDLLMKGYLPEVISILTKVYKPEEMEGDFVVLISRFNSWKMKQMTGVLSMDETEAEKNRIVRDLMIFLELTRSRNKLQKPDSPSVPQDREMGRPKRGLNLLLAIPLSFILISALVFIVYPQMDKFLEKSQPKNNGVEKEFSKIGSTLIANEPLSTTLDTIPKRNEGKENLNESTNSSLSEIEESNPSKVVESSKKSQIKDTLVPRQANFDFTTTLGGKYHSILSYENESYTSTATVEKLESGGLEVEVPYMDSGEVFPFSITLMPIPRTNKFMIKEKPFGSISSISACPNERIEVVDSTLQICFLLKNSIKESSHRLIIILK